MISTDSMCQHTDMRTIRLFQILDFMRGRTRPISSAAIAEKLGVTQRTIYRDMATLTAMGAPVRGEAGIGYQLESGFFLPPLHFDEDEMDALVLGLQMIAARSDSETTYAAQRALGKLNTASKGDRQQTDRPLLAVGSADKAFHSQYISTLRLAIRDRMIASLHYKDGHDNETIRDIRPLGLTAFENVWLLTAWCELKADFRDFRADRIQTLKVSQRKFKHEPGKRFQDYLRSL